MGAFSSWVFAARVRGFCARATLILMLAAVSVSAGTKPQKPSNDDCLACHGDATMTTERGGKTVSLSVNAEAFKNSIHGGMFACVDCHADVKTSPHETTPAKVTCAQCHADEQAAYERSFHAKAVKAGDGQAATCVSCHGSPHELLPASDPKSRVAHGNIPTTCGSCHGQKFVMAASGHSAQPFLSYEESVHGRAVASGSAKAAVCTDCHGVHEILSANEAKSSIFKFNVPATCAKCHADVEKEFRASIHGQAIGRGNWQAPVCTDCHGIHSIKAHLDPNSSVSAANLSRVTCARCHEGVRLSQEFGVAARRASTYLESYHGLAAQRGSSIVANCASCHGVHNILPSSDPNSMVNRANLVRTCGQCHPGVSEKFTLGKVHVDAPLSADTGSLAVRWIRTLYLGMILAVIGGMLVHNLIIWRRKAILRRNAQHRIVVRMSKHQRWQHIVLLSSFIILVVTGFALKYPDTWFSAALGMSERVRGLAHRIAGVVLIGIGVYHIVYAALTRDGRRLVKDFLPGVEDIRELRGTMLYYLGLQTNRPTFARFTYAEKAEYWALVWGLFVMAATGLLLWLKVLVSAWLPRWWMDVATAVHFYEAILATLAIVVWHFYQVFLDPDVYPMNWAWWDGKMSLEHYEEEHGLDTGTLLAASRLDETTIEADEVAKPQSKVASAAIVEEVSESAEALARK
jgi:cytochrome b subunit of formate dehydrogenase